MSQQQEPNYLAPILLFMALLIGLTVVFLMARGSGFFEAFWDILVFVYEVIDELWEQ